MGQKLGMALAQVSVSGPFAAPAGAKVDEFLGDTVEHRRAVLPGKVIHKGVELARSLGRGRWCRQPSVVQGIGNAAGSFCVWLGF